METREFRDLQAVLQPDQQVAPRHQAAHQSELCSSADISTQEFEGLAPVVVAEITQPRLPTGGFDQRISIEGNE